MKINYPITSEFLEKESFRNGRGHSGIDFAMEIGEPIRSIKEGLIFKVIDYGNVNAGKTVMVKWEDGKIAIHGHLDEFGKYAEGDKVNVGDIIGYAGNSGHVISSTGGNGSHLHFGLKESGRFIDPSPHVEMIQMMNDETFLASLNLYETSDKFNYLSEIFNSSQNFLEKFMSNLNTIVLDFAFLFQNSIITQYLKYLLQLFS